MSDEAEILGGIPLNPNAGTYKVQATSEAEVLNCSLITENSDMSQDVTEATESISEPSIEDSDISDGEPLETIIKGSEPTQNSCKAAGTNPTAALFEKKGLAALKSEPLFRHEKPNLERPILMASTQSWDYEAFTTTVASQLPEHDFIKVPGSLRAKLGHNPSLDEPGEHGNAAEVIEGMDQAELMSSRAEAKQPVAATTKAARTLSTSPGGKEATSEKPGKGNTAEALQGQEKTNGTFFDDLRN